MLPPYPPHPQNSREKKLNKNKNKQSNKNEQTNKKRKQIHKKPNKNKPSTVVPEFVTLDCSLTHVSQAPNTQPYHS